MDLISYYYFTELAKDLNMSRTAERIFVSQQTISNHIQRLEEYYGTPLFHRKPHLSLTYAGETVLRFADNLKREHGNLKDMLVDIEKLDRGVLRFGFSPMRASITLPHILPTFSERFPNVKLEITSGFTAELESRVLDGTLDFAAVLKQENDPILYSHRLMRDTLYLCVREELLARCCPDPEAFKEKARQGISVKDMTQFPISLNENRMGEVILGAFREKGLEPNVYIHCTDSQLSFRFGCEGLVAFFAYHSWLLGEQERIPADMCLFPYKYHGIVSQQTLSLIWRKDRYMPSYGLYFSDLLHAYYSKIESMQPKRTV